MSERETERSLERSSRQMLFTPFGREGQARLRRSRVLVVGVGATGSALAEGLLRAGVGALRLVDRDLVELSNLGRQALYDEEDIGLPKAIAASQRLRAIDSGVEIEARIADARPRLMEHLCQDVDLILDGTDNFATRYLINEIALREKIPWIYSGAIGAEAVSMPVLPGLSACLACIYPEAPKQEESCDTVGVIQAAVLQAAALSLAEALKIISGQDEAVRRELWHVDVWWGEIGKVGTREPRSDCSVCQKRRFPLLSAEETGLSTTRICSRSIQVSPPEGSPPLDFDAIASCRPEARLSDHSLTFELEEYTLTVFPDGRLIVEGCSEPEHALALYRALIAERQGSE